MSIPQTLAVAKTVVLDASGNGTLRIGPDRGAPYWRVTKVLVRTSREGQAPVPRFAYYQDYQSDATRKGQTYDGSHDESDENFLLTRGQELIAVWTGGQAGDRATFTVTGTQGDTP
ncbi:hypothetical protein ABTY59_37390 [Streptomyces sp. NPDC096079]|uniref:hypothetical protein n=1 Tax=Streptomyces sp. NPDC096079 TaxID=3155820 RepID=UPI003324BBAC